MKKWMTTCFFTLLFFPQIVFASAVLIEAKGKVDVSIAGKKVTPTVGLELPDGATVKPAQAARASVMLLDGAIFTVNAGETFEVGPREKTKGQPTLIAGIQLALAEAKESGASPTVHGMVKMGQPQTGKPKGKMLGAGSFGVEGIAPVYTTIEVLPTTTFEWKADKPWSNPVFVITDGEKNTVFTKDLQAGATRVTVSRDAAKLVPGKQYSWHLGARQGSNVTVKGSRFPFKIMSEEAARVLAIDEAQVAKLEITSPEANALLAAQLYYKHGLYVKMTETLLPHYKSEEGGAMKSLLYVAFRRMGRTDEMKRYE